MAVTLAVLYSFGTIPVSKLFWNTMVRKGLISMAISLRTLAGSKSGPEALLGLILSRSFTTPALVTLISGIDRNGIPSGDGMLLLSSLVHVDSYFLLRISALSFGSAWSRPFSFRGATALESFRSDLMNDQKRFCFGLCSCFGSPLSMIWSTKFQYDWRSAFCSLAFVSLYCLMSCGRPVLLCFLKYLSLFRIRALTAFEIHGFVACSRVRISTVHTDPLESEFCSLRFTRVLCRYHFLKL